MKEEALRIGEDLLNEIPELKTSKITIWKGDGSRKDLRLLFVLLKENAIPTKVLNVTSMKTNEFKRKCELSLYQ